MYPNVFRIVSSVDTLNKKLGLKLATHNINYSYSFQDSKTFGYYFKIRHGEMRLILGLSDSNKKTKGNYLIVLGNWYPNGIHCPTSVGKAGRLA